MKKRALSLLMAMLMVVGLLPATTRAAGTTLVEYFSGMPITAETEPGYPNSTKKWTVSTLDGETVLVSGNKGMNSSTSTLQLTMTDAVNLSFEYKVSTEAKYDKLAISNGDTKLVDGVSGLIDWTRLNIDAAKGDVISIVYSKDSSSSDNDDCVYLRNFTCGTPVIVTFHANGGEGENYTQNIYGGKGTLTANTFTKSGKVFAGWATSADGAAVYADGAEITVESNTDLYAVWGDAYTVTFVNGETTSIVDVTRDTAIGAKMPADPTKTGYLFGGWFNGDTRLTAETVIGDNVTYTAKWTPIQYIIVLNPGDGVGEKVTLDAVYDQEITLPKNIFTYGGYDFVGWSTSLSSSYGSTADEATVKNLTDKDGTTYNLYAAWQGKSVNVTLDFNYEGKERETRTGTVGSNFNYNNGKFSSIETQTRTGYLFDGWFDAAESGNEITNQNKFTTEDAEKGVTLYAHWSEAVTITFDANDGTFYYAEKKDIRKGTAYGSLPDASMSGKKFAGWYTEKDGGTKVENDTIFNEDTTLYARYRNYQITVSFNANGGTGEMEKLVCESGVATKLPKCTFTREGYDFEKWSTSRTPSSYSTNYEDGADYVKTSTWSDTTATLYAIWKENISKAAIDAIGNEIPSDNLIRVDTTLPTSGTGYTIAYTSDSALLSGGKLTLPESGTAEITVTATITDTATQKTYTKEYTLTLYSAATAATEAELNKAVEALGTKNFMPVYGTDTNAITAVEKKLLDAGCKGITVSIKEAAADSNGYAGIDQDGTIHYYFNPNMTKYGGYFYTTFVLSKNGASVEKKWYTSIDWDKEKVRETLEEIADTLTVPETATADMKLPAEANGKGWSNVKWTSSDAALKIGTVSYSTATYPVTLNAEKDTTVVLTATVKCNSVDGVFVTREFECTVPGNSGDPSADYQTKLETALTETGLKDFVTGEKLTADENGVYTTINDIQLPTTRNIKIDGKYTPVVITSSDADVIEAPTTPNSARVYVYRPLPGQSAKTVTLTMKILDRPNGPQTGDDLSTMRVLASKEIKVTVEPLTQAEIDAEIELMQQVKENYWNGIRNANTDPKNVITDMHAFQECYLNDNGELTWVYDYKDLKNHGIVPVDMDGWYDAQQWRLFKSSNAAVVSHENLLVTRSEDSKAVTITSWLSSETLGKYAEKYPNNAEFQKLYQQPVSVQLVVTGTKYAQGGDSTDRENAANDALNNRKMVTVKSFTLTGTGMGFKETANLKYDEGSTVFDVFTKMLNDHGYTCKRMGSYIASITSDKNVTLEEFDEGKNSGWMYRVNGVIPNKYMAQYVLEGGEEIEIFFTKDYTNENGYDHDWSGGSTAVPATLPFLDVVDTSWYYAAVKYAYEHKLLSGTSATAFSPEVTLTRGMVATILYSLDGSPAVSGKSPFSDVADGQWYAKAVTWAAEQGIVSGVGDGKFAPEASITREQLAAILYRYAQYKKYDVSVGEDTNILSYDDAVEISTYAVSAIQWACGAGLMTGRSQTTLAPVGTVTRAEAAVMFQGFRENTVK